jgi:dimethylamine/trimethylamine dehydrogenase
MGRDPAWDVLFEPVRLGPKTLKNRFYQVPHCLGAGSEKPGMQAALREVKAEGGWAAICTEACSVHPECDSTLVVSARLWDEGDVRNLARTCEAAHRWGALAGVELGYSGANATGFESRAVPRAPSQIAGLAEIPTVPLAMNIEEIEELQEFFVLAALRARDAGFDIVYVYGGSDEAPAQFLLLRYNKRTDAYGGSFENRARFWLETLAKVRGAVGETCAIATRISIDRGSGYISVEEACAFVELADHLVDLWDVKMGSLPEWGWDAGPSRFFPENYQARWLREIKAHTTKPVVGTGRFTSPDTMAEVIRSGQLDLIGAARPSIADPFLPRKIEEGRVDDIRECIGCNVCSARHIVGGQLVCTQNATAGEEYRRGWHPERFARASNGANDVLIIGAGPAGLECARVLGERGLRRVHIVDAQHDMGGAMRWIQRLPGLAEWGRVVDYRRSQIAKLANVEFLPAMELGADGVLGYGADIVVVATGSFWSTEGLNGQTSAPIPGADAGLAHVATPEQIMVGGKPIGDPALVFDCDGYFMGVSLAEELAREGRRVFCVTPFAQVAPFMHATGEIMEMLRLLRKLGVSTITSRMLHRVEPGQATCVDSFLGDDPLAIEAESIILVTQRLSNDGLFRELRSRRDELEREGVRALLRIGDCVAPRLLADAIFDGHRLGREIDSPDPSRALPFIRERRIVGEVTDELYDGQRPPGPSLAGRMA